MRIGVDARVLQHKRRGQGQYVYYLVRHMAELSKDDEFTLFYNGIKRGEFAFRDCARNIRQVWCGFPGTLLAAAWPRLRFPPVEYFIGPTDIFHNTINFNFTHYTPIPANGKMVSTFHGMADPSLMWDGADEKMIYRWFNVISACAHEMIATSNMAKDMLLKNSTIDEDRVTVIYYGVDSVFKPETDSDDTERSLLKFGLAGKKYILAVGSAEKNKNLSRLVEAFKALSGDAGRGDLLLVLAGVRDDNYARIGSYAESLGIGGRVIMTGHVDHCDLPSLYNGALAYILPSLVEGFGIPAAEAMACGTPAIVTRKAGVLEIAGDAALTFDPEDTEGMVRCMRSVLDDPSLKAGLRDKGMRAVKQLSWSSVAARTLEVYRKAILRTNTAGGR